jgi:flagellar motility protein MotE (MotC chaperone)
MKKTGYDQFFKAAKVARSPGAQAGPKKRNSTTGDAEQRLRQSLRVRKQKPKQPFPLLPLLGTGLLLSLGFAYLSKPEMFETLAKIVDVKFMGQANAAEEKSEKPAATQAPTAAKDAVGVAESKSAEGSTKAKAVSEDLSYIDKLRTRKEELDLREKELGQLEEELQRQKAEVDQRIRQLEKMRQEIAGVLKERVDADETQVNKLVELYSSMKPKQAADVIGSLKEELAVQVLSKMKKKNAAEVMNLLPAEKARGLSEKLTGYKR